VDPCFLLELAGEIRDRIVVRIVLPEPVGDLSTSGTRGDGGDARPCGQEPYDRREREMASKQKIGFLMGRKRT